MQVLPGIYLANGSAYQQHQNGYLVVGEGAALQMAHAKALMEWR